MKIVNSFSYLFLSFSLLGMPMISYAEKQLNFGVYAYQSKLTTQKQYQALTDYFTEQLPNTQVNLRVFNADEMINAVRNKQVDFILVNPNLYEIIRHQVKLNGITATQQKHYKNQTLSSLGGVIFSLANQSQIKQPKDLVGAKIAIPSFSNTGAFRVPLYELHTLGIEKEKLNFITVGDNDAVIQAVLEGRAQAGFVRTGIIESWIEQGKLVDDELHIINQKEQTSFPQLLSTRLYPEWPFIILPNVNPTLTRQITVALYQLNKDHPALVQGGLAGFTTPQDYLPFQNLLRELKLYPYNQNQFTLAAIWKTYQTQISLSLIILVLLLVFVFFNEFQNRKIRKQKIQLDKKHQLDLALLSLPELAESLNEKSLMQKTVEILEQLTRSKVSFIHFISNDQTEIQIITWSENTLNTYCHIKNYDPHYPLTEAGVWAEAARQKKAVLINDYPNYQHKNGLPEGHAALQRLLSVPVLDEGKVKVIAGVGNKDENYTEHDINIVSLILNEMWRLIKEKRYNFTIQKQKIHYQHLLDNLGDDYVVFTHNGLEGVVTFISKGVEKVFGLKQEEILNTAWFEKVNWDHSSLIEGHKAVTALTNKTQESNQLIMSFYTKTGEQKFILVHHNGVYKKDKLIAIEGLITNITQRIKAEQRLKQAALVFENSKEGIMITDNTNRIIRVNNRFTDITGYSAEEALGKNPKFLSSGHQDNLFYKNLWASLLKDGAWKGEVWNRRKNGEAYPQNLSISVVKNEHDEIKEFVAIMTDISLEKEQERKLERMAHYDALTGLPNRFLLSDRLTQAIESSHRDNASIAIMFIDLDGFKNINDQFGHEAGDYLLKKLAERFKQSLRAGDTVSRIGGDEFVVVLTSHKHVDEVNSVQERILNASVDVIPFQNHQLKVSSSIGVVLYTPTEHKNNYGSEQLIRYADQAMYHAKELGKNRIYTFEWGDPQSEFKLKDALNNQELELYYQPKVDFSNNSPPSFEALIRWNHPEKGILPPAAFLHQITTTKNQITLANFVLNEGLNFVRKLRKETGIDVEISINVDSSFLVQEALIEQIKSLFENEFKELNPKVLTLEILESSAIGDMKQVIKAIHDIHKLGVKIAIDDFGTGHASLNYLKDLPVDIIKIDQAFVRNIFLQPNNVSILEAINSMAEAFEMNVIAEGVETLEHIELLLQLDINNLQGYGISKPIRSIEVLDWLKNYTKPAELKALTKLNTNGKNFLKAKLYHSAWNLKIKEHVLQNVPLSKSENSHTTCPFGRWLDSKSKTPIGNHSLFKEINEEHINIHSIANNAITAKSQGDLELAKNYIQNLDTETNTLLEKLEEASKIVIKTQNEDVNS